MYFLFKVCPLEFLQAWNNSKFFPPLDNKIGKKNERRENLAAQMNFSFKMPRGALRTGDMWICLVWPSLWPKKLKLMTELNRYSFWMCINAEKVPCHLLIFIVHSSVSFYQQFIEFLIL